MRHPAKVKDPNGARYLRREMSALVDETIGRILICFAVLLVGAIILTAESRLPEELRFGLFEAMYTSP
jgi:hypothetical protein